ncbi:asparagine synthetase B [Mariniphaga sediminis]|uniref:Asparagine synthetase B n=2 Tax=Mariniphaga sediminis TaxID=1628158 RepID=A0A399CX64_9BACT|nr:asparagine synthetase B [Mariniphaga sediminis]RIH63957.1 asparagine synthetase B [Mariniphaga sediminis]
MRKKVVLLFGFWIFFIHASAIQLLIPMDDSQQDHLKSYGIAYWVLQRNVEVKWLLNYRGGSFLIQHHPEIESECVVRGVSFETITDVQASAILNEIAQPEANQDAVSMNKAPRIAVYSPPNKQPWDDAVTLVLTYAEIEYDIIYDEEILNGKLVDYDWLHLHHEDFTGQFGKFWRTHQHMPWYQQEVGINKNMAEELGFLKVSEMKSFITREIDKYVVNGGFLFAMCAATDTYDIARAATGLDICESMFDGDPAIPNADEKLDFSKTFAFENFKLEKDPNVYEFSNIDATNTRHIPRENDFFSLFEFSAKWDPIPTMLCQNHRNLIKGFMGQTTAFRKEVIKPNVLIMGENKPAREARYIHGEKGKGFWTFYGGHDPEDYRHLVGDPPTDLNLYPNSPGYRLILNNVLFPAAKKKKRET